MNGAWNMLILLEESVLFDLKIRVNLLSYRKDIKMKCDCYSIFKHLILRRYTSKWKIIQFSFSLSASSHWFLHTSSGFSSAGATHWLIAICFMLLTSRMKDEWMCRDSKYSLLPWFRMHFSFTRVLEVFLKIA